MSVRRSTHRAPSLRAERADGARALSLHILALFLAVRVVQALCTSQTLYQPDEFWQALEIAHRLVFSYGYRTWEWTNAPPIRSIVHPATFVPLYTLLRWTGAHQYNGVLVRAGRMSALTLDDRAQRAAGRGVSYRRLVQRMPRISRWWRTCRTLFCTRAHSAHADRSASCSWRHST